MFRMSRCIGKSCCDGEPIARGLCATCYTRHRNAGTLDNYPTMRERTRQLRAQRVAPALSRQSEIHRRWRENRYAERVPLDDYLVHPTAPHGRLHTYLAYGCRGPMCRAAQYHYRDSGEMELAVTRDRVFTATECVTFDAYVNAGAR